MDDLLKVIMAVAGLTGFPILLYAGFVAIRQWERRLEGKAMSPSLQHELEDLRARVAGLERVEGRVEEVEERLDFAERLLVRDGTLPQVMGNR